MALALACGPKAPNDDTGATQGSDGDSTTSTTATTSTASGTTTSTDATTSTTGPLPTTTGGTTDGASGSSATTGSFIMVPDGGPQCGAAFGEYQLRCSGCDLWGQDCPDGEKCTPYSSDGDNSVDSQKCVPVDPNPGKVGDPCTTEGNPSARDTCDIGALCWDIDPMTMMGTCVGLCTGSPETPECPPGQACMISNDGALILCVPQCNPLAPDCDDGDTCIPDPQSPDRFICVVDASFEEGQAFDPCEFVNTCDPGLTCQLPELAAECDPMAASGCCIPFCDTSMPACPGAMQVCKPWFEPDPAPPGLETVGICALP